MPKIVEIESTPNPNAKKFILNEPLTTGSAYSYDSIEQAKGDALAEALFDIEHITTVFYVDHWLTITQDGSADWADLEHKAAQPLANAPAATTQVGDAGATNSIMTSLNQQDQQRLLAITSLIDQQIRPALQGDGGDLEIVSLDGNQLNVHYQGACGSCPSAIAGTLRGIENLVRTIEPEIDVAAV